MLYITLVESFGDSWLPGTTVCCIRYISFVGILLLPSILRVVLHSIMEGIEVGNLVNLEERNDSRVLNATLSTSPKTSSNFSSHSATSIVLSLFLFFVAGLFEIGGGYLVWRGIRDKFMPALFLPLGSAILIAYGFVVTLQPLESFGRTFAIYGGFFILLSYLWGYLFDGLKVDLGDVIGTAVALAGVCIAWFWPR